MNRAIFGAAATILHAEGARVAVVTCRLCGAAVLIDPREKVDPVKLHSDFHDRLLERMTVE